MNQEVKVNTCKKILFLGASITQGKISASFVNILIKRLGINDYSFINQGVAGYEAYNILKNLDKAIKLKPAMVIILVGTNDVLSALDPVLAQRTRKLKKIPHEATLDHYINNITSIIQQLKSKTQAEIALASLPVIGENLASLENRTVDAYNSELKNITKNEYIVYLPVNEKQKSYLMEKNGGKGKDAQETTKMAFQSLFLHYVLFRSLDAISKKNGFLLLTDGIHQNSTGAGLIADEMENFITSRSDLARNTKKMV